MKKLVSLVLVAALTMGVLSGCSTAGESSGAAGENPTEQEVTSCTFFWLRQKITHRIIHIIHNFHCV